MTEELEYLLRREELIRELRMKITYKVDPHLWNGNRDVMEDRTLLLERLKAMKRAKDALETVILFPTSVKVIKDVRALDALWEAYRP